MDQIERVARALCLADGRDPDSEPGRLENGVFCGTFLRSSDGILVAQPGAWCSYKGKAKVAIETMRDVDSGAPGILIAGKKSLFSCSEDPELGDARKCWHAMIDEMLKE